MANPMAPEDPPNQETSHFNSAPGYQSLGKDERSFTADGTSTPSLGQMIVVSRKVRRKEESVLTCLCAWIVDHQIGLSTNFLILLFLSHICFPAARRHTRKFFQLSYYSAETHRYGKGWNDLFLVVYWVIVFTGLRAAVMDYILTPFAQWAGVAKAKGRMRFAEQAWLLLYYTAFWTLGMYIMYNSKYWLNLRELWTDFPERDMTGLFKWYYLVQYAFWIQQILVVNIEERRKDYHQMFTHHIITCALMFGSYGYHFTRIGNAFLCVMDVVDLLLPMAKMLKYAHFNNACDIAFGVFVVTWFGARHVLYIMLLYSVFVHLPPGVAYGCYTNSGPNARGPPTPAPAGLRKFMAPFTDPEGPVCWTPEVYFCFQALLVSLQVITCVWFVMIIKVVLRVIKGGAAEDSRSDEEGDEPSCEERGEHKEKDDANYAPLEEEVGVEGINLEKHANSARLARRSVCTASGVTLPGHSDRKELLGRIGCDKGV